MMETVQGMRDVGCGMIMIRTYGMNRRVRNGRDVREGRIIKQSSAHHKDERTTCGVWGAE